MAERAGTELGKSAEQVADEIEIREGAGRELIEATATASRTTRRPPPTPTRRPSWPSAEADRAVVQRALASVREELAQIPAKLENARPAERSRAQLRQLEALQVMQMGDAELVQEAPPPGRRARPSRFATPCSPRRPA